MKHIKDINYSWFDAVTVFRSWTNRVARDLMTVCYHPCSVEAAAKAVGISPRLCRAICYEMHCISVLDRTDTGYILADEFKFSKADIQRLEAAKKQRRCGNGN